MDRTAENVSERNFDDLSHLNGGGNQESTGQIQVLGPASAGALTVRAAFAPVREMAEGWLAKARAINVTSIEQVEDMALARESRIGLSKVSGAIDRWHKEHKADALARGREVDNIARDLKAIVTAARDMCRHQEEFAARHEAARLDAIRTARGDELRALGTDPALYTDLAHVSADGYAQILAIAQRAHAARVEEERLAEVAKAEEAQRIAAAQEAERLERIRQAEENARLKAEEAHEAIIRAEREAAAEALRLEREERDRRDALAAEALRIEREAAAAIAREKEEAARVEREKVEAALRLEREAREKIEADARRAREEHEETMERLRVVQERDRAERERVEREKAEALAEEQRQKALAPDREKLLAYAEALAAVPQPSLATDAGFSALGKIAEQVLKLVAGIRRLAGGL